MRFYQVHVNKCTLSWRARPNWGRIQHAPRVPADHVTCAERKNLLVSLLTQESSPCFCTHAHTHTHTHKGNAGENPRLKGARGSFSFYSPPLSPSVLRFSFFKSCNTGKYANHGVATVGFSQWEHSVIPAGLRRRVNTFFSQARNSLAGAGVRRRGRGGGMEGERGG